jgi:hypothetical protein
LAGPKKFWKFLAVHSDAGYGGQRRPPSWMPPGMFRLPAALTGADVVEADAELRALRRHSREVVEADAES